MGNTPAIRPLSALDELPEFQLSDDEIDNLWRQAIESLHRRFKKILVLDDDPTGSQTVYDLPVYTELSPEALKEVREDESHVVYILTNSRSLHPTETEELHRSLISNWKAASATETVPCPADDTLIISRSDSTLRGHYPLETDIIIEEAWNDDARAVTVLVPFFPEGGRFTFDDTHYVREGERLLPAAETEFAADSSFGYAESFLPDYVEEKTGGEIRAADVVTVEIDQLRRGESSVVTALLLAVPAGGAVVVNATDYRDLKIFAEALSQACDDGGRFVFRSAAALVKILAGLEDRPLLERKDMLKEAAATVPKPYPSGSLTGLPDSPSTKSSPGLLVAGSYVGKTTKQLAKLVETGILAEVTLNIREALYAERFPREVESVRKEVHVHLAAGRSVGLYTTNAGRREFLRADEGEEGLTDLELSARISTGLVDLVAGLKTSPSWVITKGGITSHDIACRSLQIRKAMVLGQILPGVPVWRCGPESRWPGIPLVIFPGNVGDEGALTKAVETLIS